MCSDESIYTGRTNILEDRIKRHNSGQVDATKNLLPVEIQNFLLSRIITKLTQLRKILQVWFRESISKRHFYKRCHKSAGHRECQ
jgi:predicted GIY-YIG superfamily endonuclease